VRVVEGTETRGSCGTHTPVPVPPEGWFIPGGRDSP
jgi:hypothetical protein